MSMWEENDRSYTEILPCCFGVRDGKDWAGLSGNLPLQWWCLGRNGLGRAKREPPLTVMVSGMGRTGRGYTRTSFYSDGARDGKDWTRLSGNLSLQWWCLGWEGLGGAIWEPTLKVMVSGTEWSGRGYTGTSFYSDGARDGKDWAGLYGNLPLKWWCLGRNGVGGAIREPPLTVTVSRMGRTGRGYIRTSPYSDGVWDSKDWAGLYGNLP